MNTRSLLLAALFLCILVPILHADEKASLVPAESDPLTSEAQAAVDELKKALPAESEPMAMLEDILKGNRLSANDGWFPLAKSQTRYGWEYVAKKFDSDKDSAVTSQEFSGSEVDFVRLDRNGDEQITAADFDWSENSLTSSAGLKMFFMADKDANGKVTEQEFISLFKMLDAGDDGYLSIDELREKFPATEAPARPDTKRPDRPNRSTLILALKNQELGSLQAGPKLDDIAPDFTLTNLEGGSVTLSKEVGNKPIVLIFGNFTCGPFRSQSGNIEKLYERYKDRAKFFLVYVREAHPKDSWWMTSNQRVGIDIAQPKDFAGRREVAEKCQKHLDLNIPFLVDSIDDFVGSQYSGMPNRLYLVDRQGRIAFKNGRGPFGFHPRQLEQSLILLTNP